MKYSFQLFIADGAPGCAQAVRNLRKICARLGGDACEVRVIDIHVDPRLAETERIMALPTLVKTEPGPALRVVGDLSDHERILAALGAP
jgi:circadian clock protein KaiB